MKVLLTGSAGYIGAVAHEELAATGHSVTGLDLGWYDGCDLGPGPAPRQTITADVRDVTAGDLVGFDAVVHLAAISNDPIGELNEDITYAINERASVQLAARAREAGVERFIFSSSCSLYGAGEGFLDETADFAPVTAYGRSKVQAEMAIAPLAGDHFSPTYMRNATVYGASPRLRGDVVVNNLTGVAFTTGRVHMMSDGTPWRPLLHVRDACRAIVAALAAPREIVHNQAINIGRTDENYRIGDVAEIVRDALPGTRITYADGAGPDLRDYRVDCSKLTELLPDGVPTLTVRDGVSELVSAFEKYGLKEGDIASARFTRLRRIAELREAGRLSGELRWSGEPIRFGGG